MGPNWKLDGSNRSPVQSLEITGSYCEDEDMETYLSDADREAEQNPALRVMRNREKALTPMRFMQFPVKTKRKSFNHLLVIMLRRKKDLMKVSFRCWWMSQMCNLKRTNGVA